MYLDPENRYQIRLPAAPWISISLDGAALSFRQPALQAAIAFSVECTSSEPGELPWVARHLFFGLREKRFQRREQVSLHGAEGVRTWLVAELDGAPVAVEGVTARRGQCLYDFMYVAPPDTFAGGRSAFQTFVESWSPLPEQSGTQRDRRGLGEDEYLTTDFADYADWGRAWTERRE